MAMHSLHASAADHLSFMEYTELQPLQQVSADNTHAPCCHPALSVSRVAMHAILRLYRRDFLWNISGCTTLRDNLLRCYAYTLCHPNA